MTPAAFDLPPMHEPGDPFFDAAARIATQIVSHAGAPPSRATFLRLEGESLVAVAEYDESGEIFAETYRLADFPNFERAVVTGDVQVIDLSEIGALTQAAAEVVKRHDLRASAIVPVRSDGAVVGVIGVSVRDVAGFTSAQMEQLSTLAQLVGLGVSHVAMDQALRDEAERSQGLERLKGEFLNIAAHELRSPLGIINGYVSMLLEGALTPEDARKGLLRIADKAEEMGRLITAMLETARMEAMGLELTLEAVDLLEVIREATRAMEPMLGAKHRLSARGRREPIPVRADRVRSRTMVLNLLDNAVKYSPDGGDIEVAWTRKHGIAYVSVTDQGVGISREQQSMLFTRFGRLVTPETSHIRGTGLGLYLAREIARLQGGDIVVTSDPGLGTTFTITMPLDATKP